jgi:hypothetical protein
MRRVERGALCEELLVLVASDLESAHKMVSSTYCTVLISLALKLLLTNLDHQKTRSLYMMYQYRSFWTYHFYYFTRKKTILGRRKNRLTFCLLI